MWCILGLFVIFGVVIRCLSQWFISTLAWYWFDFVFNNCYLLVNCNYDDKEQSERAVVGNCGKAHVSHVT